MPTTKQRRENARRRLERQIQRRQEAAIKRRRRNLITAASLGVVVVLGAVFLLVTQLGGDDPTTPAAQGTPTPSASASATPARAPKSTSGPCKYTETEQTLTNPDATDVGLPPDPAKTPSTGKVPVTIATDRGTMTMVLDRAKAPCAVQSFLFLTGKKFFDNSPCPRVVSEGIFVLQCGDPSGTTAGGNKFSRYANPEFDTNVDPASSYQVVNSLIQAGKYFDLLVVPNGGHGAGGQYAIRKRNDFFVQHLLGVTPAGEAYPLARNDLNGNEFAGPTFSPDGKILFVGIQSPGHVLAITGPWIAS